jgi:hypothetical protein
LASRRRRRKSIGKVLVDVESRVRRVEKRPGATRLKRNVVTTQKIQSRAVRTKTIATDAVTPNEADFGVTFVSDTEPTEYLKEGTTWFDPNTGAQSVFDPVAEEFVETTAIDYTARASADGKNTIYRQDYEPTGGTYVLGDTWFDTDADNKIYRYSTAITATVTNKVLTTNVATLTVSAPHSFVVGETITVSGVDATFNGSYVVTATPTALTVRYEKTATNVPSAVSGGTITNTAGWKGFALGDGALINISAAKITAGSLAAGVIVTSNLDAGQITTGTLSGRTISGGTITGAIINLAGTNSYGEFTLTNTLRFGSPSLTWGPTASPSFEIYQSGGGSGTTINADGNSGDGYLFINAGVRIELQAPEVFFFYTPTAPSGSASAVIGSKQAYRNIYSTATAGTPSGGQDGDIVVVYT